MSTKRTKFHKAQRKPHELEKRLDDGPDEDEKKEIEREELHHADIDSIKH